MPDAELDGERLADILRSFVNDGERLGGMAASVGGLARPDAAARIVDLAEEARGVASFSGGTEVPA